MPRSAIIWTRSRKLSLNVMYHLTHRMMISWSKCRPLKRSCAEVGSVIPAVISGYRAFQQFAPDPPEESEENGQFVLLFFFKSVGPVLVKPLLRLRAREAGFGINPELLKHFRDCQMFQVSLCV